MLSTLSFLVLAAVPAQPELEAVEGRQTLVIAPLRALGVSKAEAGLLTDEIRTQAVRADRYLVVAPEEMAAIGAELERQLAGGCDETTCIAELGGALGAHFLITGTVGKLGRRFTINLKLIDIERVRAVRTGNLRSERIEELVSQLGDTVFALLGVAVKNRITAGNGKLEIGFSGPEGSPSVRVLFDGDSIGTSHHKKTIVAQVPAGEGTLTLITGAKIAEVLPPTSYPDAVIGRVPEGFLIQVPSRERLRLMVTLAHSRGWMTKAMQAQARAENLARRRTIAKYLMLSGAGIGTIAGFGLYKVFTGDDGVGWVLVAALGSTVGGGLGLAGTMIHFGLGAPKQ